MKLPDFAYHDPRTVEDAVALLGRLDNARVIAGGQSLMPMLSMRLAAPDHLIDLNGIAGLDGIAPLPGGGLRIGAMTRQRALEDSALIRRDYPLMGEALTFVGHRQTRNRGTIGGSLCNLDPAAELVLVCTALDATLEVVGPAGARALAMADFPAGFLTPALAPDELLVAIRLPAPPPLAGSCFLEFARRHGDYAIAAAAVVLMPDGPGRVGEATIAIGGTAAAPLRLVDAERMLRGKAPNFAAAAACCRGIEAMEDPQTPPWYRRRLAEVLVRRALETAWSRIG